MKKVFLVFLLIITSTYNIFAVPKWLSEIFSCTWSWKGDASFVSASNGMCKYERTMKGRSWLWGQCADVSYTYTIPCGMDQNNIPIPPAFQGTSYETIADNMTVLQAQGYNVNPLWTNPVELRNSETLLQDAVTFKLSLAGYTFDPNWLNLVEEPCPVPAPTNAVLVPQDFVFVNADCTLNLTVAPNPNNGTFALTINNYQDVLSLQIIRESNLNVIATKTAPFTLNTNFSLNTASGYYLIRVTTKSGVIYKHILIE